VNDDRTASITRWADEPIPADLLAQYGCGPIKFTGSGDALYERHLMFDDVIDFGAAAIPGRRELRWERPRLC